MVKNYPDSVRDNLLQVRSDCLTCTFRASCCSACLSRAQVPAFDGSSVLDRKPAAKFNLALSYWSGPM